MSVSNYLDNVGRSCTLISVLYEEEIDLNVMKLDWRRKRSWIIFEATESEYWMYHEDDPEQPWGWKRQDIAITDLY